MVLFKEDHKRSCTLAAAVDSELLVVTVDNLQEVLMEFPSAKAIYEVVRSRELLPSTFPTAPMLAKRLCWVL